MTDSVDSIYHKIKSLPNAKLEDLCAASSPKVRPEFDAMVDGMLHTFYSVDGYRIGTMIMVRKALPDADELAQKILDESVSSINERVNSVGFTTKIDVIENGRYREHSC